MNIEQLTPILIAIVPVLLAIIVAIQAISVALIQRGRRADKKERAVVATKVEQTAVLVEKTHEVAVESHKIANSRYDELVAELRASNERVVTLLRQGADRRAATEPQGSGILAMEVPDDAGNQEGAP